MKDTTKNVVMIVIELFVWEILVLAHHLICFDMLFANSWYMYVCAIVFAMLQYAILSLSRVKRVKWLQIMCCVIYCFLFIRKVVHIAEILHYERVLYGLQVLCAVINAIGACITIYYSNRTGDTKNR